MMTEIKKSSGNVFADLNVENSAEYLVKADIAIEIERRIKSRRLTQTEAAKLMGASQPDISRLKNGHLDGFTLERLIMFLRHLGEDVKLVIQAAPRSRRMLGRFYTEIKKAA
jgi:predicted XRE-type DNA-binding protein